MGGRNASSGRTPPQPPTPVPVPTPIPVPVPAPVPPPVQKRHRRNPFSATDNSPFHTLADEDGYFKKQHFDAATKTAIASYLSPHAVPGTLYSESQHMNNALRKGLKLSRSQQQMKDGLMKGMHNLGENMIMTRYCRVGYMRDLGCANFDKLTIATLQKRLVGKTYTDNAFVSVSCNNFSKAPKSNCFTDKAVKLNIRAPASTKAMMPGKGPGGNFGEFVLAPGQRYRITGLRWTGKRGRTGMNYYKQIEVDVEIY